ncbi:unnamed protein product [Rotaria magnacalcarata]
METIVPVSYFSTVWSMRSPSIIINYNNTYLAPVTSPNTAAQLYGVNLLMNGDGETGSCTQSNNITHPTLWSYVGNISQVAYNASGTNPSLSSTSPGPSHAITMSQSIDLFPYITVIASGNVSFNLSVWLSGYENQNDSAQVSVYFLNYAYQSVGNQTTTGLAVAADHNFITSLKFSDKVNNKNYISIDWIIQDLWDDIMTEHEDLIIEKSSVIAVLNENGRSYWLAKVINVDDENKNIEIQYFDDNTFKIEKASTELVARESILCTFGKIHHSCKQFKLSDVLQAKLVKQVAETRQYLTNCTNNNLVQQADDAQEFERTIAALKFKIEHYKSAYYIMARVADTLLMKLYLNESDDDDHHSSKAISAILSLIETGAMDDSAVVYLLLSHHHETDKVQQQKCAKILANLCFDRLSALRMVYDQIQEKINEDIKDFIMLFCLEFERLVVSFQGPKDWQFAQLYTKIIMELRKTD